MPADPVWDVVISDRGYLLARSGQLGRGERAWSVETIGSSITRQSETESRYGNQPAVIEFPVVWKDLSGGYGDERYLWENRYHYALDMDCRFPETILPGPKVTTLTTACTTNICALAELGSNIVVIGGRYAKYVDTSDDTVHDAYDFGAGITPVDAELWNSILYVGQGFASGNYLVKATAVATWSEDADVQAGYLCALRDQFWATCSTYQVANVVGTDDPFDTSKWSASSAVGDPGCAITGMVGLEELLYVAKTDGLWVFDSEGIASCVTPELRAYRDSSNGKNLAVWHGMVWMPSIRGLLCYQPLGENGFALRSSGPGRDATGDNPIYGRITALAGDDRWLYAAIYNGTDSYVLAGREAREGEPSDGGMIWHPLAKLAAVQCNAMCISGLWTNPRLWFGNGTNVSYIVLPRYTDNPRSDSNCTYSLAGHVVVPVHDSGAPATHKLYKSIEVEGEDLTSARYVEVFYRVDAGDWNYAGRVEAAGTTSLALDPRGIGAHDIAVRLNGVNDAVTSKYVLHRMVVRATERPELVDVITAVVRCSDDLVTKEQTVCPRSGATILGELKDLAELNQAVTLKDLIGSERQVVVLAPVQEREIQQEGQLPNEVLVTVRMAVFSDAARAPETVTVAMPFGGSTGGFAVSMPVPFAVGAVNADASQVIAYAGTAPGYPVFRLTGPITNPIIENEATGEQLDFTGTTIAAGTSYLIDTHREHKVIVDQNGEDKSANLAAGSDLETFHFVPGNNSLHVTGSTITAATALTMEYQVRMV